MSAIKCPHCFKSLGGPSTEGGYRVRLGITLIDDDGRVHGPCAHCKQDVTVAGGADLAKGLVTVRPRRSRRRVVPALKIGLRDG